MFLPLSSCQSSKRKQTDGTNQSFCFLASFLPFVLSLGGIGFILAAVLQFVIDKEDSRNSRADGYGYLNSFYYDYCHVNSIL